MRKLLKNVKCKNFMVTQDINQLVKLLEHQRKISEIIEKIEKLINYNLTFLLMLMKV